MTKSENPARSFARASLGFRYSTFTRISGFVILISLLTTSLAAAEPLPKGSRDPLNERIDAAITDGTKFLLKQQNPNGYWSTMNMAEEHGGQTALCVLALLSSGESHQSPEIKKALDYLRSRKPMRTYDVGLRAAVWAMLPGELATKEMKADAAWLQRALILRGGAAGMYGYTPPDGDGGSGDYSNSQYGVLGVWYAASDGMEIPVAYWRNVEQGWLDGQAGDGGWGYRPNDQSYASMTAAGAATLFVTNDYLHAKKQQDLVTPYVNKPLAAAVKWLGDNFDVRSNVGYDRPRRAGDEEDPLDGIFGRVRRPRAGPWLHYLLFGYERVGEASGLTRFGTHQWFTDGAQFLLDTQSRDGGWEGPGGGGMGINVNTAYALLFLSRGRAPVVVQKLEYEGRWNNRSRDAASFMKFYRRETERHVNWQIVSVDSTDAELDQSPVLYMAGDRTFKLKDDQLKRIKSYLDRGGILLCVNEGRRDDFTKSVRAMSEAMFQNAPFHTSFDPVFKELPRTHPIFKLNFPTKSWSVPIQSITNGVRDLIILIPTGDITWRWQYDGGMPQSRNPNAPSSPFSPLANIILYVTDSANPAWRGDRTWIDAKPTATDLPAARVARIEYSGNWDPEPAGWQRLANMLNVAGVMSLQTETIRAGKPIDATRFTLAHLAGVGTVALTPETRESLRTYIKSGGFLLADAAGGSSEAGISLEAEMFQLFPNAKIDTLATDHPVYLGRSPGAELMDTFNYRRFSNTRLAPTKLPRLRGVTVDGKLVAIVSNEDLSGALVGYATTGLVGYAPDTAARLVRNILAWRLAATAP